ncbi:MAG: hypothetical protein K1000chlam4_00804 [Chlamydiae bacterium]|nr:hypothetical protein [Chlamydiota bacterium]
MSRNEDLKENFLSLNNIKFMPRELVNSTLTVARHVIPALG